MSSESDYSSQYGTPEPFIATLHSAHIWQNDPAFGIIHPAACKVCRDFMGHVVTASQAIEPSFQQAVKERDSRLTVRFLDGVREGRRLQRDRDHERLTRYRQERNIAFDLNSEYRLRIAKLEEEILAAKSRLLALQLAQDEMLRVDQPTFSDVGDSSSDMEDFSIVEVQSVLSSSSPIDSPASESSVLSTECSEVPERIPLQILPPGAISEVDSQNNLPELRSAPSTDSANWSCVQELSNSRPPSPTRTRDDISVISSGDEALTESSASDSLSSLSSSPSILLSFIPQSASSPKVDEDPQDLETLKTLMAAAHEPGNTTQLEQVRALCSRAHRTPSPQRTDLQKYLILSWRSPQANNVPLPTETPKRRLACEIFVDASRIGIGFISNGRWRAWKLIPGWKSEGRDTSWAEMVAAELGLRTLAAAGYRSADITLRSDNSGVVGSLHSKSAQNPHESIILKEIFSICSARDIRLIPKWISTKLNPADSPSRGVYPSRLLLFPTAPPLPTHLLSFIQPALV